MKKIIFLTLLISILISCNKDDDQIIVDPELTVTDADGNVYQTITVGSQIWMLENLKTTKYNDGTPIAQYNINIHGNNWGALGSMFNSEGFYQWADTWDLNNQFDEDLPFDYYGAMYNHFAIESGKIAPVGWRMPTSQDFIELENYLTNNGQSGTEGEALKTTSGWLDAVGNGTDTIGFKGLPNGYINALGGPTLGGGICTWATSDVSVQNGTRTVINLFDTTTIIYENNAIQIGAGIRCIRE
jgi:uncharacterized protein (TIGR02145 family)